MGRRAALALLAVVAVLLAGACGDGEKPARGRIAFVSDRVADGVAEIYTVAADGTGLARLTTAPPFSPESPPTGVQAYAWSPDGQKIAFASDRDGNLEIYVINADGSGLTRLTESPGTDTLPRWSPDGKRIAFVSLRDSNAEIYIMNADGTDQTRLTRDPTDDFFGVLGIAPDPWSPDGQSIAFQRGSLFQEDGAPILDIHVMNADGSLQLRLTQGDPALFSGWSPDGKKIIFLTGGLEGPEVYVMNADGSGQTRLTENLPADHVPGFPVWSPNGKDIAFMAEREGQDVIHIMKADGSGQTALTTGACDGLLGLSWSPDGQLIAFTRGCDFEEVEVWVMKADGSSPTRIAEAPAFFPAWAPTR